MFKETFLFVSEPLTHLGSGSEALIGGATELPVNINASGSDNVSNSTFQGYAASGSSSSCAPSNCSVHVSVHVISAPVCSTQGGQ